ncbi:MAG TPA: pantoate--beta-alanine ligase [Nocardioidaceae bacterium]|nr:pantoate--beta-alanine ligase [Nocardioidaceae bacterium]
MTTPLVANTRAELADALKAIRERGGRVGFVPTMGALHEGHASLMRVAGEQDVDAVVVSIFVNPTQFAPGEDLDRYPRTFDADLELCGANGVDIVFAPSVDEVYPSFRRSSRDVSEASERVETLVTVDPGPLATVLEGVTRPTHFRGVLTVVAKLFGLVQPDVAVFGQKDYQQLTLIRRMVSDLCMGIDIVGAETIREEDGLALSSRNRYLSDEQRLLALALSRALNAGVAASPQGADAVVNAARAELGHVELDYLELASPDLGPVPVSGEARLLVAAKVGTTRLIDNIGLELSAGDHNTAGSI